MKKKMEYVFCKHCDRTLPVTEEFWYRYKRLPSGFATHMCKECRRAYAADRAIVYRREKKRRELEKEQFMPGIFGPFEKAALEDQFKREKQKTFSTDMEIL